MGRITALIILVSFYGVLIGCERNKFPLEIRNGMAVGTVIGKEQCNADTVKDYWLIEIHSAPTIRKQYGDTVTVGGTKYFNMIKTTGITGDLKKPGQKIGIEFNISDEVSSTSNCSVYKPLTYRLKIAEMINCGPAVF